MQIVYSNELVPNLDGRKFQNPDRFTGVLDGATKVYLNGDFPKIRAAYEAENVPVADISEMRALPKSRPEPKTEAKPDPKALTSDNQS